MEQNDFIKQLITCLGDKANIKNAFNCYTRIRVNVNNVTIVKDEEIKKLEGVIGVVVSDSQVQIIVGPGKSVKLTQALNNELSNGTNVTQVKKVEASQNPTDDKSYLNNKQDFRGKLNKSFNATMKKIAGIFVPIIPAFIACGLILAILEVVRTVNPGFFDTNIGKILETIALSIFLILSVVVGYNACKEFGGDGVLGACIGGILSCPALGTAENPTTIGPFIIYANLGGVITVLMVAIGAAYFEKLIRKFMPNIIDAFATPFITLIVAALAGLFLLMPLGGWISQGIGLAAEGIAKNAPALLGIIPMFYLFLVLFGVHHVLIPVSQTIINTTGNGWTPIVPVQLMAGAAEVGAAIFVLIVSRNKKLRSTIIQALPIGFLGIDEPLIWGMSFPHRRLFLASSLGGGIAGAILASLKVCTNVPETTGIEAALLCGPDLNNKWHFALCFIGAIILGFIFAALIGYKDTYEEVDEKTGEVKIVTRDTSLLKQFIQKYRAAHPKA